MCHKPTLHSHRQYLATPTLSFQIGISTPRANHWSSILELVLIVFGALRFHFAGIFELLQGYSSCFAARTARTQRIGQRGKKRAYLAQPKADWGQTWPSLALRWAEQEPTWTQLGRNLCRTRASWLQLGVQP